jgi:hypothetical protein
LGRRPGLLAEELAVQPARLPRRQTGRCQHLGSPLRDFSLFRRQRRRIALPPQECADMFMKPCWLAGQLVSDPMQFLNLVKKGFELLLVDVEKVRPARRALRAAATRSQRTSCSTVFLFPRGGITLAPADPLGREPEARGRGRRWRHCGVAAGLLPHLAGQVQTSPSRTRYSCSARSTPRCWQSPCSGSSSERRIASRS